MKMESGKQMKTVKLCSGTVVAEFRYIQDARECCKTLSRKEHYSQCQIWIGDLMVYEYFLGNQVKID